ncbi:MAG: sigma-54-dependent transcriptional regulator [Deltaproteobacteria bacterium]
MERGEHGRVRVLIVEDDAAQAAALSEVLAAGDREILVASDAETGIPLARSGVDLVVADYMLPGMNGVQMVRRLREEKISAPVLIVSGEATVSIAVEAMKAGVLDFVQKPFDIDFFRARVAQAVEMGRTAHELAALRRKLQNRRAELIIGVSPAIAGVRHLIASVARTDVDVALYGETGTGKELAARAVHEYSARSEKPFVVVDCAALPEPLLENELFGHEAGAFTGALRHARGLLAEADGGTLFVDEIGEMPLSLQSKLLRFLQTKEFRRVGASRQTRVDVRVVVATNRELEAEVAAGRFRQDLFYRINVFPIRLPPLRERPEDVPLLADHFLRSISSGMGRNIEGFTAEALDALSGHDWPGNVRQLENVVRRLAVMSPGPRIGLFECEAVIRGGAPAREQPAEVEPFHQARADALVRFEKAYLDSLLRTVGTNVAEAARRAGIDRKNLWLKLRRHGMHRASR